MNKHTKEPWFFNVELGSIEAAKRTIVYMQPSDTKLPTKQQCFDALRIISCVNACEGINPDAVPQMLTAVRLGIEMATRTNLPATVSHLQNVLFFAIGKRETIEEIRAALDKAATT